MPEQRTFLGMRVTVSPGFPNRLVRLSSDSGANHSFEFDPTASRHDFSSVLRRERMVFLGSYGFDPDEICVSLPMSGHIDYVIRNQMVRVVAAELGARPAPEPAPWDVVPPPALRERGEVSILGDCSRIGIVYEDDPEGEEVTVKIAIPDIVFKVTDLILHGDTSINARKKARLKLFKALQAWVREEFERHKRYNPGVMIEPPRQEFEVAFDQGEYRPGAVPRASEVVMPQPSAEELVAEMRRVLLDQAELGPAATGES